MRNQFLQNVTERKTFFSEKERMTEFTKYVAKKKKIMLKECVHSSNMNRRARVDLRKRFETSKQGTSQDYYSENVWSMKVVHACKKGSLFFNQFFA